MRQVSRDARAKVYCTLYRLCLNASATVGWTAHITFKTLRVLGLSLVASPNFCHFHFQRWVHGLHIYCYLEGESIVLKAMPRHLSPCQGTCMRVKLTCCPVPLQAALLVLVRRSKSFRAGSPRHP